MSAKRRKPGRSSPERDEAPEITDEWVVGTDIYHGKKLVRRGRPNLANLRKLLSLQLPPEVIENCNATGPGWQTRMARVLERSTPKPRRSAG